MCLLISVFKHRLCLNTKRYFLHDNRYQIDTISWKFAFFVLTVHTMCQHPIKKMLKRYRLQSMTRLKNVRVAAGHTLVSLSVATGGKLKPSRIGNYDNGSRKISLEAAEILARALNVTTG